MSAQQGALWANSNPGQAGQPIIVQLVQSPGMQPGQPMILQPMRIVGMQPGQPVLVQSLQGVGVQPGQEFMAQPEQSTEKQPDPPKTAPLQPVEKLHNHTALQASMHDGPADQTTTGLIQILGKTPPVRTMQMRYYAFAEIGVLVLIFSLSIASLANPSVLMTIKMYPADQVSEGLGIPSIIVVFSLMVRLVVLCLVRWVYRKGLVEIICLWVAAGLWTLATLIHILITIGISGKEGDGYVNAGLPLAIVVSACHVPSVIVGKIAIKRLIGT